MLNNRAAVLIYIQSKINTKKNKNQKGDALMRKDTSDIQHLINEIKSKNNENTKTNVPTKYTSIQHIDETRQQLAPYVGQRHRFIGTVGDIQPIGLTKLKNVVMTAVYLPYLDIEIDHLILELPSSIVSRMGIHPFKVFEFTAEINRYLHGEKKPVFAPDVESNVLYVQYHSYGVTAINMQTLKQAPDAYETYDYNKITPYVKQRIIQIKESVIRYEKPMRYYQDVARIVYQMAHIPTRVRFLNQIKASVLEWHNDRENVHIFSSADEEKELFDLAEAKRNTRRRVRN